LRHVSFVFGAKDLHTCHAQVFPIARNRDEPPPPPTHCGVHFDAYARRMASARSTCAMRVTSPRRSGRVGGTKRVTRFIRVVRASSSSPTKNVPAPTTKKTSSSTRTPKTLGWGERRGAIFPDDPLLLDERTFGYCVYSHADWSYAYKSVALCKTDGDDVDHDLEQCAVEGTIPAVLNGGVLYRNGPALFTRGGVEYKHMLDGDGMVLRFAFGVGNDVAFTSRFVRTDEFTEESFVDATTRRGPFGTPKPGGFSGNAFDLRQKNLANTNILAWGGKIYALYEAGRPVELDPVSLACLGETDLGGKLRCGMFVSAGLPVSVESKLGVGGNAFTAHPHIDPHRNKAVGWSWSSLVAEQAVEVTFFEWEKDWSETHKPTTHKLANCEAAPHDFAVTKMRYVLIQNRLKVDPGPYVLGLKGAGECLVSQPELPVVVHVVPRPGALPKKETTETDDEKRRTEPEPEPAVSVDGPSRSFEIHVAFAHDGRPIYGQVGVGNTDTPNDSEDPDGSIKFDTKKNHDSDSNWVTAYTAGWDELGAGSFLGEWSRSEPWPFPIATPLSPDFNNIPRTLLWRYEVNLNTKEVIRTVTPGCENLCIDHPHVNPLFEGKRQCRFVYASLSNEMKTSGPPLGYCRVDLVTGDVAKWWAGNKTFCEELVIVPKSGRWVGGDLDEAMGNALGGNNTDDAYADEKEEECWLVGMLAEHGSGEKEGGVSCLAIFDGADLARGPVAKIKLKHRVPHGLHGAFVPGMRK
jgi:all-trans-8'-apo-beta-carotenal 15,15'-oxygenase